MRLVRIRLRNFRCFREEMALDFDDITALVGKNDAGKSSIMDALDIFLNDALPDKHDASKGGRAEDLTIICEFDILPSLVVIDEDFPTNLASEYLLNADGRLEIHKTYSGNLVTPKCANIATFAVHPTVDGVKDLLQLKNPKLKERAKQLGVNLSGVDLKVNAQIREAIRKHVGNLNLAPIFVPLNEENAKDIWVGLRKYLPAFALFKSDRPSTDQDPEAQDPLKAAVKEAIKAKETELNAITKFVETEVRKIAIETVKKLKEMDSSLASQLNPQISVSKWDTLFKVSITGDDDIPLNKRGSGVKRMVLLNFFRARAEQIAKETEHSKIIYGIEEPETSQHPNNQRLLLKALTELSTESQVIISTHTPMIARGLPDKNILYIDVKGDKTREILVGGEKTNLLFTKALGVLPDNKVKLFIGVEGKHDISFLQAIAKALMMNKIEVLDLERLENDGEIIFFPCGGSNLAIWSSRLARLNKPEFHLCDRDFPPPAPPKYQSHCEIVNQRGSCKATNTQKKEIENYLHKDAIVEAYSEFGIKLTIATNFSDFDDVPLEIARLVHHISSSPKKWDELEIEQQNEKIKNAKKILNSIAPKYMNKKRLLEIDPQNELLCWFKDMKELMALCP